MRKFVGVMTGLTVAWSACAPVAIAQVPTSPDAVLSNYQDYLAAEKRDDLPAAETAAGRALAAAEARDGGAGSTAVLAMNLAIVRIDMGHRAGALAPARRALQLAQAGAKGVDVLAARLTVGEAELALNPRGDETGLLAALREADGRSDLDSFAYSAAVFLGAVANELQHWSNARVAWQSAQRHVQGAPGDPVLALDNAMIGEGVALTGADNESEARLILGKAAASLAPLAPESADRENATVAEVEYAQALAWLATVSAKQATEGQATRPPAIAHPVSLPGQPPLCPGTFSPSVQPILPPGELQENSFGAGVLRFETAQSGDVTGVIQLAAIGGVEFRDALKDPRVHWSFKPSKGAPPGCRLNSVDRLATVLFQNGSLEIARD